MSEIIIYTTVKQYLTVEINFKDLILQGKSVVRIFRISDYNY